MFALRAERYTDAKLIGPLRNGVRQDAVQPYTREEQREQSEEGGESLHQFLLDERTPDMLGQAHHFINW
jgi:hypothetical protein